MQVCIGERFANILIHTSLISCNAKGDDHAHDDLREGGSDNESIIELEVLAVRQQQRNNRWGRHSEQQAVDGETVGTEVRSSPFAALAVEIFMGCLS